MQDNQNIFSQFLLFGRRFVKNETGATSIEYAVIIALIAVALVTTATVLGQNIITNIDTTSTAVSDTTTS